MKKHLHLISIIFSLFIAQELFAQKNDIPNEIISAFKEANANAIAPYLNENVELIMPQTDNFFTRQHAKSILSDFFRKNPVKDFSIIHKGTKENASFVIATYLSNTGSYRVSISLRKTGNQSYIYQLRIEKSE
jgi:hypothetical protein